MAREMQAIQSTPTWEAVLRHRAMFFIPSRAGTTCLPTHLPAAILRSLEAHIFRRTHCHGMSLPVLYQSEMWPTGRYKCTPVHPTPVKYDSVQFDPRYTPQTGHYANSIPIPVPAPVFTVENTSAGVNKILWGDEVESFTTPKLHAPFSYYLAYRSISALGPWTLMDSVGKKDPRYWRDSTYLLYDRDSNAGEDAYYIIYSVDALGMRSGVTNLTLHNTQSPAATDSRQSVGRSQSAYRHKRRCRNIDKRRFQRQDRVLRLDAKVHDKNFFVQRRTRPNDLCMILRLLPAIRRSGSRSRETIN